MDDPRIRAILEQLQTITMLLVRPVVQRQVFAFLLVVLIAWLIPIPYRYFIRWFERRYGIAEAEAEAGKGRSITWQVRVVRLLRAVEYLLFPIIGLILGGVVSRYMLGQDMSVGLFVRLMRLVWLILAYRIIIAFLYATLNPETARKYQRRFVAPVFGVLFVTSLTIGLAGAFPLGEIELFQFMGQALSLGSIATAAAILYLTFAFAWIVRDILGRYVIPRTQADPGVSHTIELVVHYSIIGFGIFIAASALGFDLTALLVVFGGLSVGIGFGLQELVANFISGVLLVFEQTLRPGDVVEVEGQRGVVSQMGMRATVLKNIDNVEIFVPNKTLLTSSVAAYTMTDRIVRRTVAVGVSYDSNPSDVRDILLNIAERHGLVLNEPAPIVFFSDFGDSSLDFELAVWVDDPMRGLVVTSDIRFMIFSEFAKNGITIPFPQRDINLPADSVLRLSMQRAGNDAGVTGSSTASQKDGSGSTAEAAREHAKPRPAPEDSARLP